MHPRFDLVIPRVHDSPAQKIVGLAAMGAKVRRYSAWKTAAGWLQERSALVTKHPLSDRRLCREKRESTYLDALTRRSLGRRSRVDEGCVRRETRPAILFGIINFEHQSFVAPHLRKIEPTMIGIVLEPVSLSHSVRIATFRYEQIFHLYALGVGYGQRICLDRLIDRPPHLDDREAAREQCLGLIRESFAHPLWSGPLGIVIVRREHGLANKPRLSLRLVARAQRMIEDDDAGSPRCFFDQLLDLRVIHRLQLRCVEKVGDFRPMLHQHKTLLLERELVGESPAILDCHLLQLVGSRSAPANIIRTEGLVYQLFAGLQGVGNTDSHCLVHKDSYAIPSILQRVLGSVLGIIDSRR